MFEGERCPYCNKQFLKDEDIVVCPICGTPHHRECYKIHNHCANESNHGSFEWKSSHQVTKDSEDLKSKVESQNTHSICPVCGTNNDIQAKYCSKCGTLLPLNKPTNQLFESVPLQVQQVSTNERIDGIPIRDWLVYLGPTSVSHIRTYLNQNNKNSIWGFAIGALLFPVLYFLYYRVWGLSAVILIVDIICNAPTILLQVNTSYVPFPGMTSGEFVTLANILSYVYLIFVFLISLFAKTIVRKNSVKAIKRIRRSCNNENDYSILLSRKACPNKYVMGCLLFIYVLYLLSIIFL